MSLGSHYGSLTHTVLLMACGSIGPCSGYLPVILAFQYVEENLGVMSIGFLLASPDDAVIWRGPKKNGMAVLVHMH